QSSPTQSRNTLNPYFTESITRDSIGQAVSRNHVTTGLMTLFLTNAHAAFSESRIVLNPALIRPITSSMTGHAQVLNQPTTAPITVLIAFQTVLAVSHRNWNAGGITFVTKYLSASRAGKMSVFHTQPMNLPIAENVGETTFCHSHTMAGPRMLLMKLSIADMAGLIALFHIHTAGASIAVNAGYTYSVHSR